MISLGREAVPALIYAVANVKGHARWEAIEALGSIGDPEAANILVDTLIDEDLGIRWAASNALIKLDRAAVEPLLIALTKHFDSVWLRRGAHHILHALKTGGIYFQRRSKCTKPHKALSPW